MQLAPRNNWPGFRTIRENGRVRVMFMEARNFHRRWKRNVSPCLFLSIAVSLIHPLKTGFFREIMIALPLTPPPVWNPIKIWISSTENNPLSFGAESIVTRRYCSLSFLLGITLDAICTADSVVHSRLNRKNNDME